MKTTGKVFAIVGALMLIGCCGLGICVFLVVNGLGAHYEVVDGKAVWVGALNHDIRQTRYKIDEADVETFRVFSLGAGQWASDKDRVYFEGRVLRDADPENFEIVDHQAKISRSGDNEYQRARKTKNDAENLVSLGAYSTDVNGVYWFDRLIPGADSTTFKLFEIPETEYKNDGAWAVDASSVYCNARRLEGSDPKSFRLLGYNYGIDQHRVYHKHTLLTDANPETFVVTYHQTKFVIGYDGNFIWTFEKRVEATPEQKQLIRSEQ